MSNAKIMAVEATTGGDGLRVAVYYRMSSDEQDLSIGQQQTEVRKLCANHGWIIVAEYIDSGKSGSKDIAKRTAFHKMIGDAKKGEWSAVVCYNSSRFGRLDTIDSGPYKSELRKHGVYLETVTEGRFDWRTSMGRIQDAIFTEQNNKYSTDISSNAIRGRMDILSQGYWAVGVIPFGYDREFVEGGVTQMVVARDKAFKKPRNWHTKLKVNEAEAEIVLSVYKRFVASDLSARALVKDLNAEGVKSNGKVWSAQSLLHMLRDVSYIGQHRVGHARKSKEAHGRMTQTVKEGVCPPIVDRELFDAVQAKLDNRDPKTKSTQVRSGTLSGVLICGHCGYRMDKREKSRGGVYYVCSSANRRQHLGCKQWSVRENDILPILVRELLSSIDFEVVKRIEAQPSEAAADTTALAATIAKLEKGYERARTNLLMADADLFAQLQADTLRIKAELDKARNTLTVAADSAAKSSAERLAAWRDANGPTLVELGIDRFEQRPSSAPLGRHDLGYSGVRKVVKTVTAERAAVRGLLKGLGATLTLHWTPAGGRYHALAYGVINASFRQNESAVLTDVSSRRTRGHSRGRG